MAMITKSFHMISFILHQTMVTLINLLDASRCEDKVANELVFSFGYLSK